MFALHLFWQLLVVTSGCGLFDKDDDLSSWEDDAPTLSEDASSGVDCGVDAVPVTVDGRTECLDLCFADEDCFTCCGQTTNGTGVCAPDDRFCVPDCGPGEVLVAIGGEPTCLATCSYDDECTHCCVGLQDGGGACAPSSSYCSDGPGTNDDGGSSGGDDDDFSCGGRAENCVSVEATLVDGCGGDELRVRVSNVCDERIYMSLCSQANGTSSPQDCGAFGVRPGNPYSTYYCDSTGSYDYAAVVSPVPSEDWVCRDRAGF